MVDRQISQGQVTKTGIFNVCFNMSVSLLVLLNTKKNEMQ